MGPVNHVIASGRNSVSIFYIQSMVSIYVVHVFPVLSIDSLRVCALTRYNPKTDVRLTVTTAGVDFFVIICLHHCRPGSI